MCTGDSLQVAGRLLGGKRAGNCIVGDRDVHFSYPGAQVANPHSLKGSSSKGGGTGLKSNLFLHVIVHENGSWAGDFVAKK